MKFRSALTALIAIAVAGSIAFSATPAKAEPGDGIVTGKVTDSATGAPLGNVCVVNGPVASVCWSITNASGEYKLTIPGLPATGFATNIQFFRTGFTSVSRDIKLMPDQSIVENIQMVATAAGQPIPSATPPKFIGNPPPGASPTPAPTPTPTPSAVPVEQRIADFWKKIDALGPNDNVSAGDLGGWALNVIERQPRARLTAADFRSSTAMMQAGLDRAGLGPVPAVPPTPVANVEQRIADFWKKIDALGPADHVSAADLGQWALNVIARIPRAQLGVGDFRASTAAMQGGFDRAGLAPLP